MRTAISVRKAELADSSTIALFISKIFHEAECNYIQEDPCAPDEVGKNGPFLIATDNQDTIVGCVEINHTLHGIFKLGVETSVRKQGIGTRLISEAENYAKGLGWPIVKTGVANFREDELLPFYTNLGYTHTGRLHRVFGPGGPYYLIELDKHLF